MRDDDIASRLADEDFAGLERAVRERVRRDDAGGQAPVAAALLGWLLVRWRERPLPRLGELVAQLGASEVLAGPATRLLRGVSTSRVESEVWDAMLAAADACDVVALFEAAVRVRLVWIDARVRTLRARFGAAPDPRVASVILRWLAAPPMRATSSQAVWNQLLELLFEQADPRTLAALETLAASEFPAGSAMQRWMAARLARELARWRERPEAAALAALCEPGAEGPLAATLDAVASCVAALTGGAVVLGGGERLEPELERLLEPSGVASAEALWASAEGARVVDALATRHRPWSALQQSRDGGCVAVADARELVVFDAQDRVRWRRAVDGPVPVTGFALSGSGRWLAILLGEEVLELVDLEAQRLHRLAPLALGVSREPEAGLQMSAVPAQSVAFAADDERTIFSVHALTGHGAPGYGRVVVVETRLDATRRHLERRRELARLVLGDDASVSRLMGSDWRRNALLLPSPDGRWLFLRTLTARRVVAFLERVGEDWLLRQVGYDALGHIAAAWDAAGERLAHVTFDTRGRLAGPSGWIEPTTGRFTLDGTAAARALRGHERVAAMPDRALCAGASRVLALAAEAPCLLAAGERGELAVWREGAQLEALALDGPLHAAALAPDASWLLVSYANKRAPERYERVGGAWKKARGKGFRGHKDPVGALAIDAGGERVVSIAMDTLRVWSATGEPLHDLRHRGAPLRVALRSCGRLLASAEAHRVVVWDLDTGYELALLEPGDAHTIAALTWDLREETLLVAWGTALLRWRPGQPGANPLLEHAQPLTALLHRPGDAVLVGDATGTLSRLDGDRLVALAVAAHPLESMAAGAGGRLALGAAVHGRSGNAFVLEAARGAPAADWLPRHAPDALEVAPPVCDEVEPWTPARYEALAHVRARADVLRRAPRSSLSDKELGELRKGLRHAGRFHANLARFAARADTALWECTLAEIDLDDPGLDSVFVEHLTRRNARLAELLSASPASAPPIVAAYRDAIRTLDVCYATPPVALATLHMPAVTRLHATPQALGDALRGLPALSELTICDYHAFDDVAGLEARLGALSLAPGCRPWLRLALQGATRPPQLAGTPFDHVVLDMSALETLRGLDEVVELHVASGAGLADLTDLAATMPLRALRLATRYYTTTDGITSLEGLPRGEGLRRLELHETPRMETLAPLEHTPALEQLSLVRCTRLHDLDALAGLGALRELTVDGCAAAAVLPVLSTRALERLTLVGALGLSGASLAGSLGALHELVLRDNPALDALDALADAPCLRVLDLRRCKNLRRLPALDACRDTLEAVYLEGCAIEPASLPGWLRERASWMQTPASELRAAPRS